MADSEQDKSSSRRTPDLEKFYDKNTQYTKFYGENKYFKNVPNYSKRHPDKKTNGVCGKTIRRSKYNKKSRRGGKGGKSKNKKTRKY